MTEPMERSLTDQSDKNQDVGCTPKSVPLMNTADEVALSDKEAVKRLPYAAFFCAICQTARQGIAVLPGCHFHGCYAVSLPDPEFSLAGIFAEMWRP